MKHARDGWLGPDGTWHAGEPPQGWRMSRDGRWRPTLAAPMRAPRYVPPPTAQSPVPTLVETEPDSTTAGLMRRRNLHRQDPTLADAGGVATARPDGAGAHPEHPTTRGGAFSAEEADDADGDTPADAGPRHLVHTGATAWVPGLRTAAQRTIAGARATDHRARIGAGVAAVVLLTGLIVAVVTLFGSSGDNGADLAGSPSSSSQSVTGPPATVDGGPFFDDLSPSDSAPSSTTTTTAPESTTETTTEASTRTTDGAPETSAAPPPPSRQSPFSDPTPDATETSPPITEQEVYYRNCGEVRRRGIGGLRPGDPGYRPGLDHNDSGVACAPE